jgi:hypothetical protein
VIGTDLAAIQPDNKPPNCSFIQDDSEEEWVFPTVPGFDYIHFRLVFSCFNDPKQVIQRAYDNMRPGGWIEFHDSESQLSGKDEEIEGRHPKVDMHSSLILIISTKELPQRGFAILWSKEQRLTGGT